MATMISSRSVNQPSGRNQVLLWMVDAGIRKKGCEANKKCNEPLEQKEPAPARRARNTMKRKDCKRKKSRNDTGKAESCPEVTEAHRQFTAGVKVRKPQDQIRDKPSFQNC